MFVTNRKGPEMDEFDGICIKERELHSLKKSIHKGRTAILRIAKLTINDLCQFLAGKIIFIHIILL